MFQSLLRTGLPLSVLFALTACTVPAQETSLASPVPPPVDDRGAGLRARGEYLVRIAGCNDCHTPAYGERGGKVPKEEWLTGSPLGFHGPWGTTYPANLRLKAAEIDEAGWLEYTANLHTRPLMPDYSVRDMSAEDRLALYRFLRALGPAGTKAPEFLPPGKTPAPPYLQLVLPPSAR